jgi:teichuronic acid biosynthesis glycosyltransferase TuaG
MDTISVIIPTWNRAATLAEAIQSVLAQTYPILEILVCDDGSTDHSQTLVEGFEDERVKWVAGPASGGPATPRNRGLALSKGDWLAFLDSDDQWHPEKLAQQMQFIKQTHLRALCSNGYRCIPGQPPTLFHAPDRLSTYGISDILTFETLLHINYVICSSALLHRSLIADAHGFPEHPSLRAVEDYALWLRIAASVPFGYVSAPLVNYRDTPTESIRKSDNEATQQRKLTGVMEDLLRWNKHQHKLSAEQVRMVHRRIRLHKRPFWQQLYKKTGRIVRSLFFSKSTHLTP